MKKGFTLVELIAVIGIIAIMAVLFIPSLINVVKDNGNDVYKIKEEQIRDAVNDYVNYDDSFVKPTNDLEEKYVKLSTLVSANYLSNIIDNTSGNVCSGYVIVSNNSISGYNYQICLLCDNYTTDKSYCSLTTYQGL